MWVKLLLPALDLPLLCSATLILLHWHSAVHYWPVHTDFQLGPHCCCPPLMPLSARAMSYT
jgi:hypothetical protein